EQDLGDLARLPVRHTPHLAQLLHQVRLRVKAAGGVGQHEIRSPGAGPLYRVEDHRAGVAALVAAHEVGTDAFGPQSELLGRGGAERVAGRHHDGPAFVDLALPDLADRGRLAD